MRHTGGVAPRRHLTWILALSFWTALGAVCGLQIWIGMLDHHHSLVRLVAYQVLRWNAWFALTPLIGWLASRFPLVPPTARAIAVHAFAALAISPIHSAWWAMLLVVVRPYDAMGTREFAVAFRGVALSGLAEQLLMYGGVLTAHHAALYYRKYRERERLAARLEASLAEARLHALELQLQPHFLFNTLNAAVALARAGDADATARVLVLLGDLLRQLLRRDAPHEVPLREELALLDTYLEIQRVRFGDRLRVGWDVDDAVRDALVPQLVLQPLVENALQHGIAPRSRAGRLDIIAARSGDQLRLAVRDDGPGIAPGFSLAAATGLGLRNTRERLRRLYGERGELALATTGDRTTAAIELPLHTAPEAAGG